MTGNFLRFEKLLNFAPEGGLENTNWLCMFPTWKHKAFAAINLCDFDCYIMFLNII